MPTLGGSKSSLLSLLLKKGKHVPSSTTRPGTSILSSRFVLHRSTQLGQSPTNYREPRCLLPFPSCGATSSPSACPLSIMRRPRSGNRHSGSCCGDLLHLLPCLRSGNRRGANVQVLYLGTPSTSGHMTSRLAPPPCVSALWSSTRVGSRLRLRPKHFHASTRAEPLRSLLPRSRSPLPRSAPLCPHPPTAQPVAPPHFAPAPCLTSTPSPNSPTTQQRCRSSVM
jgi:hypothetical protein